MSVPSVALRAIGCRTNQQELSTLGFELARNGFTLAPDVQQADIVVVNTCCVTGHTESKTRRAVRSLARKAPQAKILVTGCMVQRDPHAFDGIPGVQWVVGNTRKNDIFSIVKGGAARVHERFDQQPCKQLHRVESVPALTDAVLRTRYAVKIQEGCDYRCAYCIVPSVRGPSRSLPQSDVLDDCREALDAGFGELIISGTHIGQYKGAGGGLVELLENLCGLQGNFRVRLSSLDPRELTPRLVDVLVDQEKICDYCHLSVQSFDSSILRAMNRPADTDFLLEQITKLRQRRPLFAVGADLIVGFPGETDAMFSGTLKSVTDADLAYGHVFRFSKRPGTPAATFDNQVSEREKTDRSRSLRALLRTQTDRFVNRCLGSVQRVIVEQVLPARGVSSNYLELEIDTPGARPGGVVLCTVIKQIEPGTRRCEGQIVAGGPDAK